MFDILEAVLPVFLVIMVGTGLRLGKVLPDSFWAPAEKLTYYVTFPALLAGNLARADMGSVAWAPLMAVGAAAILGSAAVALAARRPLARLGIDDPSFTSIFQGSIRPNTYIGLAVAAGLYGAPGVTLTAISIAVVVPLVNVLAVTCMVRFGHGQSSGAKAILRGIVTNPLILGCVVGILMNVSGLGLPPGIGPVLEILGRAALPVGLLAVGAGLSAGGLAGATLPLAASMVVKFGTVPALVALGGLIAGFDPMTLTVAVLYGALPCSASTYVLARQMGGNAPLMASIITGQTLLSALAIPTWTLILQLVSS